MVKLMNISFNKCLLMLLLMSSAVFLSGVVLAVPLTDVNNKHRLGNRLTYNGVMAAPSSTFNGTDQICVFCHTPHAAAPESTLWSRPDPKKLTFPLYGDVSGAPLVIKDDATASANSQYGPSYGVYPNGASRLCMSCHDGITAIGLLRDNSTIAMLPSAKLDGDGSFNDSISAVIDLDTAHPISFVYNETVKDNIESVRGLTTYEVPIAADDVPLDGLNRMQCTTCHDPHDDTRLDGLGLPFWRHNTGTTASSYNQVCDACHTAPASNFVPGVPAGAHDLPFPP